MRGVEQIPWAYDALIRLFPGLARWRSDLVAGACGRVLEVGCGTGLGLREFAGRVDLAFGIDPNAASLARAHRRVPVAGLAVASAEHLPFGEASFDCVVSSLVFCSVSDPERGLAEIRRVLKPGGCLLMLEHVQARSRLPARLLDLVQPAWTALAGGCHPNRHTERTVAQAGF
ncbi:MAG: class I SAM-dependent methyltransferase, partial [Wenzhouxiangella sp.]